MGQGLTITTQFSNDLISSLTYKTVTATLFLVFSITNVLKLHIAIVVYWNCSISPSKVISVL